MSKPDTGQVRGNKRNKMLSPKSQRDLLDSGQHYLSFSVTPAEEHTEALGKNKIKSSRRGKCLYPAEKGSSIVVQHCGCKSSDIRGDVSQRRILVTWKCSTKLSHLPHGCEDNNCHSKKWCVPFSCPFSKLTARPWDPLILGNGHKICDQILKLPGTQQQLV